MTKPLHRGPFHARCIAALAMLLAATLAGATQARAQSADLVLCARLAADPDDGAAHLLFAQIILKRPDPPCTPAERRPSPAGQLALEHLDRVRPRNPSMSVIFHLCRGNALNRLMRFDGAEAAWLEVLGIDLSGHGIDLILGWDVLARCVLTCDGPKGRFSLRF